MKKDMLFSLQKLKKHLQEFSNREFYNGTKYSDVSISCDLSKGNCYDISEELYDFLKNKGCKDLSLVEVREPKFDLKDAHSEWQSPVTEYSNIFHIILKVNDYFIDFTGIQYSKDDIGLKIYTEEQLKKRWGKISYFDKYAKGGLIAPNGKPSNLTAEQYKLVRTPAFKKWFGDWENAPENASKMVDENGEPMVIYHGTNKDFDEFSIDPKNRNTIDYNAAMGIHFTTDKIVAQRFADGIYGGKKGSVKEVFLNIRNPKTKGIFLSKAKQKEIKDKEDSSFNEYKILSTKYENKRTALTNDFPLLQTIKEKGISEAIRLQTEFVESKIGKPPVYKSEKAKEFRFTEVELADLTGKTYENIVALSPKERYKLGVKLRNKLLKQGYDAVIYENGNYNEGQYSETIIVLDESKIKIYRSNPDIRFQQGGELGKGIYFENGGLVLYHGSPYEFKKFKLEKIGTGEGAQAFGWGLYFTEVKDIAKSYAKPSIDNEFVVNGVNLKGLIPYNLLVDINTMIQFKDKPQYFYGSEDSFYKRTIDALRNYALNSDNELLFLNFKDVQRFEDLKFSRNLYEVKLFKGKAPEQYTWLEWYKPITENILSKVITALKKEGRATNSEIERIKINSNANGEDLYNTCVNVYGSTKEASLFLLRAGIDGIKFPTESIYKGTIDNDTARGFNYVVFDANDVIIDKVEEFKQGGELGKTVRFASIAKDHLKEDPKYYTKLMNMENKMANGGALLEGKIRGKVVHKENGIEYYDDGSLIEPTSEEKLNWEIYGFPNNIEKTEQSFETIIDEISGNTKKEISNKLDDNMMNGKYAYLGDSPNLTLVFNERKMEEGGNVSNYLTRVIRGSGIDRLITSIARNDDSETIEKNTQIVKANPNYNTPEKWERQLNEEISEYEDKIAEIEKNNEKWVNNGGDSIKTQPLYIERLNDIAALKKMIGVAENLMENNGNHGISTNVKDYKNPYQVNRAIEKLLDAKGSEQESYTPDEINFISYYSGYGGLDKLGKFSDEEIKGLLYEFYTPDEVVQKMWGLAYKYGYGAIGDNSVFEPSVGIGAFLKYAPDNVFVAANEINKYSATICEILYPNVQTTLMPFEKNFISKNLSMKKNIEGLKKYSLIIGNPPYGKLSSNAGLYMPMGEDKYSGAANWAEYFLFRGIDLLQKDGLLIYVIGAEQYNGGSLFLDSPLTKTKKAIFEKADLIDAYRLPNKIFERTGVSSEIVIFRKR